MDFITLGIFLAIAGILFLGFISELLLKKFEIPGVLLLLFAGLIAGQAISMYGAEYGLSQQTFLSFKSIIGALTLVMLLFDGGMLLNIYTVIKNSIRPMVYGVLIIIFTAAAVGLITHFVFGWNLLVGLLLGVVLGGSSPAITIPIAKRLKVDDKTRTFIMLEPSFTDVMCAVLVVTLTGSFFSGATLDPRETGKDLLAQFSIGAVIGGIIGVIWLVLLKKVEKITEYIYMATFAVLLLMFVVVEYFEASGYIAALIFGLVLGNRNEIANMLKLEVQAKDETERLRPFHAELSFLVRTFFFVYLGLIVPLPGIKVLLISALVMVGLIVARYIATVLSTMKSEMAKYRMLISSFVDRGLSVAVLSTYPLSYGGIIPANVDLFPSIAFTIIVFSSIVSTIGIYMFRPKEVLDIGEPPDEAAAGLEKHKPYKKHERELVTRYIQKEPKHKETLEEERAKEPSDS